MPADEKKGSLRAALSQKSTEELEELLALDFAHDNGSDTNADYILTIMEVIREREGAKPEQEAKVDAAWNEFLEYAHTRDMEKAEEAGSPEEPLISDHSYSSHKDSFPAKTHHKSTRRLLRWCAAIAAALVLLCGTAYASGWNIFQALAEWTAETFHFIIPGQKPSMEEDDPFEEIRLLVAQKTDIPAIPRWAPGETEAIDEVTVTGRKDRDKIRAAYHSGNNEFSIAIVVYLSTPDVYTTTYQKDMDSELIYKAGGIVHYLADNRGYVSATWQNGIVEGHIQGKLTMEELQRMIDSIYEG